MTFRRMNFVIPDNAGHRVMLWLCDECGAMVGDKSKHEGWHSRPIASRICEGDQ